MKKIAKILAVAAVAASSATSGFAATVSDGFTVKIKVNPICRVTAADVDFGTTTEVTATPVATPVTGAVAVHCSKAHPFSLSFTVDDPATNDNDAATTTDIEPTLTSISGNMTGAIAANTDTVPFSLGLSGTSGTGLGLGVPQAVNFTINGLITAAVPNLTPDDYASAQTLYVTY